MSGKRGSCPADVVEAVTRIIDMGSTIAILWSCGLSCFDDLTAEPDVFSEIVYEEITLVDQGYTVRSIYEYTCNKGPTNTNNCTYGKRDIKVVVSAFLGVGMVMYVYCSGATRNRD